MHPEQSQLGQKSAYITHYAPELLFPIPRQVKRNEINVPSPLPFTGYDLWNAYELSWLNQKGKPMVAIATIIVPAESPFLIESKSLKLYFNAFNQSKFTHTDQVKSIITADLSQAAGAPVSISLTSLQKSTAHKQIQHLDGTLIDHFDITIDQYTPAPNILTTEDHITSETLCSDLLKSNCLVTGQPDWGSISIQYTGNKINHENLLRYIIGFREHNEFHEQCVERIFMDISQQCAPTELTVYARYTRRGGIDINPMRTNQAGFEVKNPRLVRQ